MQYYISFKVGDNIRKRYQTEYIQFTEEQKQRAANTDLVAFLLSQGESLKRCGSEMLWEAGGRVTIRDNIWFSQYEQKGGNAVQFVQKYYNKSYQDAVQMLLDEHIEPISVEMQKKQNKKRPFELPAPNKSMKQIFAYLLKARFLDRDVVKYFVDKGLIYESAKYHNCVFVGIDKNGKARHAHKRGSYTLGDSFKGNVDSCEAEYSFHHTGTSNTIYVFEAPIDMLSYISLHKDNWQQHSYVSLCSVSDRAVMQMLKDNPNINKIYLCLDNDLEGIDSDYRIRHNLNQIGYEDVSFIRPKYKDWNEILKAKNGIEPLPAVPHPALNKMCKLIKATVPIAKNSKTLLYPFKTMCSDYTKLMESDSYELLMQNAKQLATDTIRMANALINCDEKELQLNIFEHYLPHKDKECFENKIKNIRRDMYEVEKLFGNNQTRINNILKQDVEALYKLACDSLRIASHIELEQTTNFSEEQEGSDAVWEIQQA